MVAVKEQGFGVHLRRLAVYIDNPGADGSALVEGFVKHHVRVIDNDLEAVAFIYVQLAVCLFRGLQHHEEVVKAVNLRVADLIVGIRREAQVVIAAVIVPARSLREADQLVYVRIEDAVAVYVAPELHAGINAGAQLAQVAGGEVADVSKAQGQAGKHNVVGAGVGQVQPDNRAQGGLGAVVGLHGGGVVASDGALLVDPDDPLEAGRLVVLIVGKEERLALGVALATGAVLLEAQIILSLEGMQLCACPRPLIFGLVLEQHISRIEDDAVASQ